LKAIAAQAYAWACADVREVVVQTFVLLVTWIVFNQPPNSYQVSFGSQSACLEARAMILAERQILKRETELRDAQTAKRPGVAYVDPSVPPSVTAICVPTQ
jgi:hypothetical protein